MPDPQDTGATKAAASGPETGTPPGDQGGGTAGRTQTVQSIQGDQPAGTQEFEEPFDPLSQGGDLTNWNPDDNEGGESNSNDESSDPFAHTQADELPERPPGLTERPSFVLQFKDMLSEISIAEDTIEIPDEIAEQLNTTLPQIDDEEALALYGRRIGMLTEHERSARERVIQHIALGRDKLNKGLGLAKDDTMRHGAKLALKDYDSLITKIQALLKAQSKYIIAKAANIVQDLYDNYDDLRANQSNLNAEYINLQSTATQQGIELSTLRRQVKALSKDKQNLEVTLLKANEDMDEAHVQILALEDQLGNEIKSNAKAQADHDAYRERAEEQQLQNTREIVALKQQIESMRSETPEENLRTQERLSDYHARLSDVTSQSHVYKRERDLKQAQIDSMNIRNQDNHRKYLEVQNTARALHGQLQATRQDLARAQRASHGGTSTIDPTMLTTAIQTAVAAAVARPARPAALITNPYEGDIDLTTKSGNTLFDDGSQALTVTFDGKPEKLHPFLSALENRSEQAGMRSIMNIQIYDAAGNPSRTPTGLPLTKNILTEHGEIKQTDIDAFTARWAPILQNHAPATSNDQAQLCIRLRMLHNTLVNSMSASYSTVLAPKLTSFHQNGIALLYHLIRESFQSSVISVQNNKKKLETITLKQCQYDLTKLHSKITTIEQAINAAGQSISKDDMCTHLLRAYQTSKNEIWLRNVANLEIEWVRQNITTPQQMQTEAMLYYQHMINMKQWKAPTSTTPVAMKAETTDQPPRRRRSTPTGAAVSSTPAEEWKARQKAWKFNRSLSTTNKYTKNGSEYSWCTGPGHYGIAMWVAHEPQTCTPPSSQGGSNSTDRSGGRGGRSRRGGRGGRGSGGRGGQQRRASTSTPQANTIQVTRAAQEAYVANALAQNGTDFGTDTTALVRDIVDHFPGNNTRS